MHVGPFAAATLLSFSLLAQDPSTATTAASAAVAAHLTVEAVGPSGWHAQFGPTNVGGMLASQEGRPLWEPQIAPMFAMWHELLGDDADYEALRASVLGYGGAMRFALRFGGGHGGDDMTDMVVVFEPDGSTDLKAMAAAFTKTIERAAPGEWQGEAELLGAQTRLRSDGISVMTAPFVAGERMVLAFATQGDLSDAHSMLTALIATPPTVGAKRPGSPALRLRIDLGRLLEDTGTFTGNDGDFMKALGFDSLEALTVDLATAGPQVKIDLGVSFRSEQRGILASLMSAAANVPSLGHLLPKQTPAWRIGRFDLGVLYESVIDAVTTMNMAEGDIRDGIKKELGVDPGKDLLAHMSDEVLAIGSPLTHYDRLSETTWALAWKLRDQQAFQKGFDALMPHAKPFFSPSETVDVDGVTLRRYGNMVNYPIWIAVGHDLLVITSGRDAEEEATRILTAAKLPPAAAPAFAGLQRHLPDGHNGAATIDLAEFGGVPAEFWLEVLDELLPFVGGGPSIDPDEAEQGKEQMLQLLKAHQLTTMRTATGYGNLQWHWQLYW